MLQSKEILFAGAIFGACAEAENKTVDNHPSKSIAVERAQAVNPSPKTTEDANPEEAKLFPLGERKEIHS